MTRDSPQARPRLTQRLRQTAPGLYDTVAPAARAVARFIALARQSRETARFLTELRAAAAPRPSAEEGPRVLFDGCAFQDPHSGIARLWTGILAKWSESGFARHVIILDRAGTAPRSAGFTYIPAPPLRAYNAASTRSMLQEVCAEVRADVFMSSSYTTPGECRSLLYVYDMTPEALAWDVTGPLWRDKHRAIDHASAYVCLSHSTENDLRRLCPQTADRPSRVVLPGVDSTFTPAPPGGVQGLIDTLDLPPVYFVFLGHRDHYKNADLVFDALSRLEAETGYGLLLIGGRPELEPEFAAKARNVTVRIARISDEDLRLAYSGAAALLYVSRYEGFGLPIIEAMACDCPVIACRNSSLPEAAGDAALFVGEDAPDELLDAMRAVTQPELRSDLVARGRSWSAGFSWERSAAGVEAALREVAR